MKYQEAPVGRREAIKFVAATVELARHPSLFAGVAFERTLSPETEPKTASIFGLHDTPNVGGSYDIDMAIEDATRLGAKSLLMMDPGPQLIKDTTRAGIGVIGRAYLPGNRFDEERLTNLMRKLTPHIDKPVVQPFNEVNLLKETDDVAVSPQQHAFDFAKASDLIARRGGIALLTPMAPRAPINDILYLERFMNVYLTIKSPDYVAQNNAIGAHAYVFKPGQNPWEHVQRVQSVFDRFVPALPVYVTEAGVFQDLKNPIDEDVVGSETLRILETPIPAGLDVKSFCFWVLSNFAQRPKDHEEKADDELRGFELSAWRAPNRLKSVYTKVLEYVEEQKPKTPALLAPVV